MKYLILGLIALISISCNQKRDRGQALSGDPATKDPATVDNFDWLVGSWKRSNDQKGKLTYEHWTRTSDTEYTGLGCTLHDSDTVFKEHLRLVKTGANWNLEVTGVNKNPTNFPVIQQDENSFECENRNNEFPKIIQYALRDSLLIARISGDDSEIIFRFEKLDERN